jgi:serine protease Do
MEKNGVTKNIILVVCSLFIGAVLMYGLIYLYPQRFSTVVTRLEKDVTVNENGISDAVEKVYDAVVVVSTYSDSRLIGSGTGFVFKTDGNNSYILTNNHVIKNGDKVTVTFTDGKVEETKIIGSDEYADIAVLSIDSSKIKALANIGSNAKSRIGDTVFAVGAPINNNFSWTVTRGILSGKDRMVEVSLTDSYTSDFVMKVLQTDAAINAGNSGGPLCNSNGEVIGITSLKLVSSGVEGMGFAIPIEDAVDMAEKIIAGEKRQTPYIGINMADLATAYYYREYYDLIKDSGLSQGVLVISVEKDGGAYKAGLKANDIITKIGDIDISSIAYLRYALYQYKAGDKVTFSYYRDGKINTTEVTLGKNKSTT